VVVCDVAPCSLVLKIEAVCSSETGVHPEQYVTQQPIRLPSFLKLVGKYKFHIISFKLNLIMRLLHRRFNFGMTQFVEPCL
jgi:hypothetical protein